MVSIGKEAHGSYGNKYDFERPDYKAYVKRMKKREKVAPTPNAISLKEVDKVTWKEPK